MPNIALLPSVATTIPVIQAVVDGWPDAVHRLETSTGNAPLEDGREVTDHAVARQAHLTLTGWVSNFRGADRPRRAWLEITRIHKAVIPLRVITEWRVYNEMLIFRAEAPQKSRGLRFTLELREVIRVGITDTELPPEELSGPAEGRSGEVQRGRVGLPPPVSIF